MIERRRFNDIPTPPSGKDASATAPTESINFNDAVREAKEILRRADKGQYRLGELAHKVNPVYGLGTLKQLAKKIGVASCTLERHRSVYRAWAEVIPAPGPESGPSYSVLRELANHPDRARIVKDNPEINKKDARQLMRRLREQTKPAVDAVGVDIAAKWNRDLMRDAHNVLAIAPPDQWPEFDVDPSLVSLFKQAADHITKIAGRIEQREKQQRERDATTAIKPAA